MICSGHTIRLISLLLCAIAITSMSHAQDYDVIRPANTLPDSTPWNLESLSIPPTVTWLDQESDVHSLLYAGEQYEGHATEVFAYYASPTTLQGKTESTETYPAVVLVHGGGGTAFKQWATLWAKRGYAAIAMDLAGKGKDNIALKLGGPDQGDDTKFGSINLPLSDQWSYHAVANVVLAHSLIRSIEEVDAKRTAITGISWGGYLTSIVAGLDNRFKAAVPVYGCGHLQEHSVWLPRFAQMTAEEKNRWVTLWDPSSYIGSASMPVFFVNGTNDFAYWLESYSKTYDLVNGKRNLRITVNMPHGHEVGWAPKEIGMFIDQYVNSGPELPFLKTPKIRKGEAIGKVSRGAELRSASLHYTSDHKPNPEREWKTISATIKGRRIYAPPPPKDTTIWFFTARDTRNATVSSKLVYGQ